MLGPKSALTVSWRASAAERRGAPPQLGSGTRRRGSCAPSSVCSPAPRCAPRACESFSVDASLGVVVRVCGADPVESREKSAAPRWPLSRPTDVLVAMTSPNFAEDEGKVGLGVGGGEGSSPRRR